MATFTAQILIGEGHPNHGGIEPRFVQWLSENSTPAWILEELPEREERERTEAPARRMRRIVWIPQDPSTILEDGLLLTLAHGFQTEEIRKLLPDALLKLAPQPRGIELDGATRESIRRAIHESS